MLIALIAGLLFVRPADEPRYRGQAAGAAPTTTTPPGMIALAPGPVPAPAPLVEPPVAPPPTTTPPPAPPPGNLVELTDRAKFLARVQGEALRQVTAYGLPSYGVIGGGGFGRMPQPMAPMVTMPPAAAAPGAGPPQALASTGAQPTSGTNVQEVGVDEPDVAKTDGRVLVTFAGRSVEIVDVTGSPRLASTVALPDGAQIESILLSGTRAMVFSQIFPTSTRAFTETTVAVIELADPSRPRILRTHRLAGSLISARLLNGMARVVLAHAPQIPWDRPTATTQRAEDAALARNRQRIRASTFEQWVAPGTGCTAAFTSPVESGLATVAVRTIDPAAAEPGPGVCVASQASTVYASPSSLYVGTTTYTAAEALSLGRPTGEPTTSLHRFDITDPAVARYTGSGEVAGTLLNQFSLSEHKGDLRVATTRNGRTSGSESQVAVLRPSGATLGQVGLLGGLGRTEQIFAVRFVGDVGYVVTFSPMLCDPLFVIDLTEPTRPTLRGTLEVQGFSSYLHPTTPGRVLSIGRDSVNPRTGGMPCPTTSPQISLYDVSDATRPRQLQRLVLPPGFSEAERDHHGFTYWGPSQLLVIPIRLDSPSFNGAMALRVQDGGITEIGRITHPPSSLGSTSIRRSFVVGSRLLTVSGSGVASHDLGSLASQGFTAFPAG
jgi:uncharacterized secreted protein with C-terminal beta-propeller domain